MGDTRNQIGKAGVFVAGGAFKIALYVCLVVLVIWIGRTSYQFGHDIFNQQPMSPGEGQEITVVVKEDDSVYDIAKTLESKGLVEDAKVFWVQEKFSNYKGQMKPGTYLLSTAYEPSRIMAILSGDAEQEGADS
nr:endolytic transglycosylase MltG [uncultured Blautia sp.]